MQGPPIVGPKLNDRVVVIQIENDVRKTPTAMAEEITDAVFSIFSIAPLPSDENRKAEALFKMAELKSRIFHTVEPICRRRLTAEQKAAEKRG